MKRKMTFLVAKSFGAYISHMLHMGRRASAACYPPHSTSVSTWQWALLAKTNDGNQIDTESNQGANT